MRLHLDMNMQFSVCVTWKFESKAKTLMCFVPKKEVTGSTYAQNDFAWPKKILHALSAPNIHL